MTAGTPDMISDPRAVQAIEAEFAAAVYHARRLCRLRLLGREPVPTPRPETMALYRRIRRRALGIDVA
jgi:hypothetical protein